MKRNKLQTQTITFAAATPAGSYAIAVCEIDNNFKRIAGISFIEVATNDPSPRLSLRDAQDYFIANVRLDFLSAKNIPEANDRFCEVNLKGAGNKIYVTVVIAAPLLSAYTFDIVYKLDNQDPTKKPRIKYDARNVTILLGTTPFQQSFNMDIYYRQVTAICLQMISGIFVTDYLRINLFDNIGEFIGMVPQAALQNSIDKSMEKNFTKVEFVRGKGNKITAQYTSPSTLLANVDTDLIFKLEA